MSNEWMSRVGKFDLPFPHLQNEIATPTLLMAELLWGSNGIVSFVKASGNCKVIYEWMEFIWKLHIRDLLEMTSLCDFRREQRPVR